MQGTAEAFALVRKYDVAPEVMQDVITDGLFAADVYRKYGQAMVEETYVPGSPPARRRRCSTTSWKWLTGSACRSPVSTPAATDCLVRIAHGDRDQDWTVLGREQARASGLD
jgi:3-hydroxyisobutyrate dehydrogenase-like beta-hydroxyacid dehydrogenase